MIERATRLPMALLVRALSLTLGAGAILWGSFFFPAFREDAPLHSIASDYLLGRGFSDELLLDGAKPRASPAPIPFCNPTELHDEVILRLGVLNAALKERPRQAVLNSNYTVLQEATRRALSCAPFDSFSWLTLFWLDATQHGVDSQNLRYLRLSYALGPNEAWIAVWRSRLAILAFAQLPSDVADEALSEFVRLVDAGYLYSEAAAIFASASPAVQGSLIERVKSANIVHRRIFAQTLYDKGFDVSVPGVPKPARPWQ
jgi:hypothetical protein